MPFDEEPEGDPHGECAREIHELNAEVDEQRVKVTRLRARLDEAETEMEGHRDKWWKYEQKNILPCFKWAKAMDFDLQKAVYDNPGKNSTELFFDYLRGEIEKLKSPVISIEGSELKDMKRVCKERDDALLQVGVLDDALLHVDRMLVEHGFHQEGCPGNHPAYCDCWTGIMRRIIRAALKHKTNEKGLAPDPGRVRTCDKCGGVTHWHICQCEKVPRIREAAIMGNDEVPWVGRTHCAIINDIVAHGGGKPVNGEQGFVTDSGRFVNREEAAKIAFKAGQIPKEVPRLFSEDLH